MHDGIFDDALEFGTAYGLYRHGQDRQTEEIAAAIAGTTTLAPPTPVDVRVRIDQDDDPDQAVVVNALDHIREQIPASWDDYIGQDALKLRLQVAIASAKARNDRLPHMLFAAGIPGIGKTTIARMVSRQFGVPMIELQPPFDNVWVLTKAALSLPPKGILFIDEIHMLELKRRGSEILLKMLEDGVAYLPSGDVVRLPPISIFGATTEMDMLREAVVDRFRVERLGEYSPAELTRIAVKFAARIKALRAVDDELACDIADASRGAPREIRKLVDDARDLDIALGQPPVRDTLLQYAQVEPDGLGLAHVQYLTVLRQFCRRPWKDGVEYVAGEPTMTTQLRETKQGNLRIERYLIERGLIEKTPRGRRLTPRGIARAEQLIAEGKGRRDY